MHIIPWFWLGLLGAPLLTSLLSAAGLIHHWNAVARRRQKTLGISLAATTAAYAFGCLTYVALTGPLPAFDYRLEETGLLLSVIAVISGIVCVGPHRWFSTLALATSAYLLAVFFLLGSTY